MTSVDYSHHFSSRNIPFGIASSKTRHKPQVVTRIENTVLFLNDLYTHDFFSKVQGLDGDVLSCRTLNQLVALPKYIHRAIRETIGNAFDQFGFDAFSPETKEDIAVVTMHLPINVGDFIGMTFDPPLVRGIPIMLKTTQTFHVPSNMSKTQAA